MLPGWTQYRCFVVLLLLCCPASSKLCRGK
jgi:hypothetical protein